MDTQVQTTTDYNQFDFMNNNRDLVRGHIEALKEAIQATPRLVMAQPVLVNERMQVVDGQHRLTALTELGMPVPYVVMPGLNINDARQMNILHKGWRTDDYAKSYASSGNPNYQKYLELKEDYNVSHSVLLTYNLGGEEKGMYRRFREGDFVINDLDVLKDRLDALKRVQDTTRYAADKEFGIAFLRATSVEGFNVDRFIRKLEETGEAILRRFGSIQEYLRAIEEVYNFKVKTPSNRLRLF